MPYPDYGGYMYFIEDGAVYVWDESLNAYVNIGITAKNKVRVVKELESISVVRGTAKKKELQSTIPYTLEEIIVKFGVTEENPLEAIKKTRTTTK